MSKATAAISDGMKMLQVLINTRGIEEVARSVGATRPAVHHWKAGHRIPGAKYRIVLKDIWKIPYESWGEQPTRGKASPPPPALDKNGNPVEEPPPPAPKAKKIKGAAATEVEVVAPEGFDENESTADRLRTQILRVQAQLHKTIALVDGGQRQLKEVIALESLLAKLTVEYGDFAGEASISEAAIMRSAPYRKWQMAWGKVAEEYPSAAEAMIRELQAIGFGS